jgi:hypothetical protein
MNDRFGIDCLSCFCFAFSFLAREVHLSTTLKKRRRGAIGYGIPLFFPYLFKGRGGVIFEGHCWRDLKASNPWSRRMLQGNICPLFLITPSHSPQAQGTASKKQMGRAKQEEQGQESQRKTKETFCKKERLKPELFFPMMLSSCCLSTPQDGDCMYVCVGMVAVVFLFWGGLMLKKKKMRNVFCAVS